MGRSMLKRRPEAEEFLPVRPVDFHVLLVLTAGELHGYGLVKEIARRSEGRIRLEPGNLYRYLRRLVDADLVEPADRRRTSDSGEERRRYYRITPFGHRVLRAEVDRMRSLVVAAERMVASGGPAG